MTLGWIIAGIITLLSFILLSSKIESQLLRRILGYDIYVDIAVSFLMAWTLAGTFSGMMAGLLAGLVFSIILITIKPFVGYEKFERVKCEHCQHYNREWVRYAPRFRLFGPKPLVQ